MIQNKNFIEEKIFAFLDGELNDGEEAELMSVLAKDQSARSTFKFHLKLKNSNQDLKSSIAPPQDVDDKIYQLLSKLRDNKVQKTKRSPVIKTFFWQQKFSLRPVWAMAACIILVCGTLLFSRILPSARMSYNPIVHIENIDEIQEIRKHIPKVKLTVNDRVE